MTMLLANLPKQYQETAKAYIQQTMRNNVSGKWVKMKVEGEF
jgi:uncharacterized protein YdeI (YjbR/CyaY-like superfamily)